MLSSFTSLTQRIDTCLIKHRFALHKKLKTLNKADIDTSSQAYQTLLKRIEQSQQQVTLRRQHHLNLTCQAQLPVSTQAERILAAIKHHQVVVIAGQTGSGKTTQLPKLCLQAGRGIYGRIAHTQPRRIAARSVAERISVEIQSPLGQAAGYQVRFDDTIKENTQLVLMTDGILLGAIEKDRFLTEYDTIIIDEAHERSLNIDFLLGFLKQLLPKRPDLKLIVTSATIDVERFSAYFNQAPIIQVSGRSYAVDIEYQPLFNDDPEEADSSLAEGVLSALERTQALDRTQGKIGDVLVFLPGEREIRQCAEMLRKAHIPQLQILPLYARLTKNEQDKIFNPSTQGKRVVLATNVAETSLTVPNIHYVIDSGLARISRYSFRHKIQRLPIEAISKASAKQRAGRCGRVAKGVCIRLDSEEDFNLRAEFSEPEIQRTNLAAVILRMQKLKLTPVQHFDFLDAPDARYLNDGIKQLQELEALDYAQKLTPLGRKMAGFALDPKIARIILQAQTYAALEPVLIIAAALNVQDPKEVVKDKQAAANEKHKLWQDKDSDFLSWLKLWEAYETARQELSNKQLKKWAKSHYLSSMRLREWRDTHRQLKLQCKQLNLDVHSNNQAYQDIHKSLLAGFLTQIGYKNEEGEYLGTRNKKFYIFPTSSQAKRKPKWILSAQLLQTSKLFAHTVARIEPEWVAQIAQRLLKHQYFEPHFRAKTGQVIAYQQSLLYGLQIIHKQAINYGQVDLPQAHEMYVRQALVEQMSHAQVPFYQTNQQTLKEAEKLEEKSRRRDLLIDDERIMQFYQKQIATHICSDKHLIAWYKKLDNKAQQALFFSHEFLLTQASLEVREEDFPNTLTHQGVSFPLTYSFAPNALDDGVSLSIAVEMLTQVPQGLIQWLVPGLLEDKVIALLKGLPKATRKQLVPVPERARQFLTQCDKQKPLLQELLGFINQQVYPHIELDCLQQIPLDAHFKMNIKVYQKQKLIAQGRDLNALIQQFKQVEQSAITSLAQPSVEILSEFPSAGIRTYTEQQQNGLTVRLYPHLKVLPKQGVCLSAASDKHSSMQQHQLGVLALVRQQLTEQNTWVKQQIQQAIKPHTLKLRGLAEAKQLLEDVINAVFYHTFVADIQQLPYAHAEFRACLEQRQHLDTMSQKLIAQLLIWLDLRHQILQQSEKNLNLARALACSDIQAQLKQLFCPNFMLRASWQQLEQYPRYLKAMLYRLDKLPGNLHRDRALLLEFQSINEKFQHKIKSMQKPLKPEYQEFYWLLQEWRVGLFAQPLGTKEAVSKQRLQKRWQQITGE